MKRTPESIDFEAYWHSIRPTGADLPDKSAINPANIKQMLGWTAFVTVGETEPTLTVSMIGQSIRDLLGFNLAGMDFNDLDESFTDVTRQRQLLYHDLPFGRVEHLDLKFADGLSSICELTMLPVWGADKSRVLFCLMHPLNDEKQWLLEGKEFLTQGTTNATHIDLGNGLPSSEYLCVSFVE